MTTITLILICFVILISSIKQTKQLINQFENLDIKLKELNQTIESSRKLLKNKLNRNLILEKLSTSKPIPKITFQKIGITTEVLLNSETVYSLAEDEGCGLSGTCEGNGDCGLCAMAIISGAENFDPPNEIEKEILSKLNYPQGTRLSCQAKIQGDATVDFMNVEGHT